MKIFILGPEGSGKTVLIAMLSRYVGTSREDLILEPVDYATAQYVTSAQAALEKGDWPPPTRIGGLRLLQWRFGPKGQALHEIEMFDSAGEDLQRVLLEENPANLTGQQQVIRAQIDESDFLIFLFDLEGFFGSRDIEAQNEKTWLFKTFLSRPKWKKRFRLVVVSKADIYAPNLAAIGGNVKELIKRCLPQAYSIAHLVDAEIVDYLAIASVMTETIISQDGSPTRVPKKALEASGLENLIEWMTRVARVPSVQITNPAQELAN